MDFRTAWKVIAKKLGDDKRALILAKLAELFSCGAVAVEFDPKAPPEVLPRFPSSPQVLGILTLYLIIIRLILSLRCWLGGFGR